MDNGSWKSAKLFNKFTNQTALIWESSTEQQDKYKYSEIIKESEVVAAEIQVFLNKNYNQNIGVLLHHSSVIVPVILGILDTEAAFCCLRNESLKEIEDMAYLLQCNIGITDSSFSLKYSIGNKILKEFQVFNQRLLIIKLAEQPFKRNPKPNLTFEEKNVFKSSTIMFCCSTSGTTGKPKIVQVPFKCVMPNVSSLSKIYHITQSDVIYISSPPTFDPFVVDLCLALFNGASILMVSNEIRLSPKFLLSSLRSNAVSIMQITPSLFCRWSKEDIRNQLLPSQSLRCLIFGGEPFPPIEEVAMWFDLNAEEEMRTRLFNIYGITEVSCWSTIYEVSSMDIKYKKIIPLGVLLDQHTCLRVVNCVSKETIKIGAGELLIESKIRKCVVGEDNPNDSVATGDLVEIKSGTIYYKTRLNNIVKIFGQKVNLTNIENTTKMLNSSIKNVCCVNDKNSLHLFVQNERGSVYGKKEILQELRRKLLDQEIPNEIFLIDEFPLSSHGKISRRKLLDLVKNFENKSDSASEYLLKKLEENLPIFNSKHSLSLPFTYVGGTSVLALQIVNELEDRFKFNIPELMLMFLSNDTSIEKIIFHLKDYKSCCLTLNNIITQPLLACTWSHDMRKCIDASPTICELYNKNAVSVGSHSRLLINVDVDSGELLSTITFPNRIESQVVQYKSYGIVGCYDGYIYCFDICSGAEKWKFNSGGMIKSRVQIVKDVLVFGNYNTQLNLWCLRPEDGTLIWNKKIGNKSIYAGIVEVPHQTHHSSLFVATLDGICALIDSLTAKVFWEFQLQSPVFSTPKFLDCKVIVAEVLGIVHYIDCKNGNILSSYKTGGNIYSSIELIDEKLICFGCYDNFLYCLVVDTDTDADTLSLKLLWKVETLGQMFSTPRHFMFESMSLLLVCTTNGLLCLVNENGKLLKQFQVSGEIFSSPCIAKGRALVACRNNLLYCFDIHKMLSLNE